MYKELLLFFVWRDLLVRYKQAALGIFWALIRPFLNMVVFVVIFQKIALIETKSPYPLFVLAGLIPWQFMASNIQSSSMSLIQNQVLIQKAGFPRIFLPTSTVVINLLDCLLSFTLLLLAIALFYHLDSKAFLFPLFLLLSCLQCLAVALWMSALSVRFKDITIAIPYLLQVGIFITPVGFAADKIPSLFLLNPLVGVIDGYRWILLGEAHPLMGYTMAYSVGITLFLLVTGRWYFRKVEHHLADLL